MPAPWAPVRTEFCGQVLKGSDPKKQKTLHTAFKNEAVATADKAVAEFCCANTLPFNAFDSPTFPTLVQAVVVLALCWACRSAGGGHVCAGLAALRAAVISGSPSSLTRTPPVRARTCTAVRSPTRTYRNPY